jgi:hypothetical protein
VKLVSILLLVFLVSSIATAQTRSSGGALPTNLRSSLQERLSLFTQAQSDGRWDEVARLLGRYRRGGTGDHLYTITHKQCLISQMQNSPLVAFSFSFDKIMFSTEILSMPAGSRWWDLTGEGTFRTQSGESRQQTQVVAYRDNGQWYFTPPNYDDMWEKIKYSDADFAADRASEIDVVNTPQSPLEVAELHSFMDKQYPSLRNVEFTLRNKTHKAIKAFSIALYTHDGSSSYSAGAEILPKGSHTAKTNFSAYPYFCDGVQRHRFQVEDVVFADGTEWQSERWKRHGP